MHFCFYENVIPHNIIDEILSFFNNNKNLVKNDNFMEKINNPWSYPVVNQLKNILNQFLDTSHNVGDNIYKHSYAYFPHTDNDQEFDTVNALIPLYVEKNYTQPFVIFDQYLKTKYAKTWMISDDTSTNFSRNKVIKDSIFNDKDVVDCIDKEIDDTLYSILENPFRPKELFYGLTGNAVDYKPGNLILFDRKYIHATGKMQAEYKIGLSLRFKGNINEF